ncbi:3-vinyl bacteriochlorophyllide hydratase [Rhodothalassium salexigens DSM 2132]|uniref:3-vinyl bacteriochlorophyllide hydratase n=1 Tax=Rhodothalassium salexigens DSM 2132 TaxID=1188247 RepID=A0A4R2PMP2_RHOSA|nr:2-vinyl bacteriochlorophyllide hydratase [Rhodothalassium salexigens]MBB4211394.1 3-vinyl bacteriochlorophyllide hydratase [Rhodothalassium salexigens DSM 2132]MBK1637727.1 2-vinyl bacteriochlorophyllide hydratase [Rhodothalassium salexigens DSM 2132]MBK5920532.1 2-vinyl bacteriochlorophyllide hydratase [Rhodothalassium salexigens]TCP35315.1 3-vinyl bacteriochlorophyllide hydratase [Rhodothalassium salexigens DSM 2132]
MLYTPEQRRRRDASPWTPVQGFLAAFQFLVFLVSLGLVLYFLATGEGWLAATISIVFKTLILYTIMVTGAIWEKEVFGQYLFAPTFFWEDVVSFIVISLHTAYMAVLIFDLAGPGVQMAITLAAYATYAVNAAQFLLKLRAARLQSEAMEAAAVSSAAAADGASAAPLTERAAG